jgi:phosphate transport system substrate-binding protein
VACVSVCACGGRDGVVAVDGSSTVFPINEAVAEEFRRRGGGHVTVGISGTGGGFQKFCKGELALSGASRPIGPTEARLCAASGIDYVELPVAFDGIAVVVHPDNDWVDHLTIEELARIWAPEAQGSLMRWSDVRPQWPDTEMRLFGPGVDSGTYDYFTKAVLGREHMSRGDYTASENDNVLVRGIANQRDGLGFFGLAYFLENKDKLRLVPIDDERADNGFGPIAPSLDTVRDGSYQPLSRPMFLYVSKAAASRPEVAAFVEFYLEHGPELIEEVGYITLPRSAYGKVRRRFALRTGGSVFEGDGSMVGVRVDQLFGNG